MSLTRTHPSTRSGQIRRLVHAKRIARRRPSGGLEPAEGARERFNDSLPHQDPTPRLRLKSRHCYLVIDTPSTARTTRTLCKKSPQIFDKRRSQPGLTPECSAKPGHRLARLQQAAKNPLRFWTCRGPRNRGARTSEMFRAAAWKDTLGSTVSRSGDALMPAAQPAIGPEGADARRLQAIRCVRSRQDLADNDDGGRPRREPLAAAILDQG